MASSGPAVSYRLCGTISDTIAHDRHQRPHRLTNNAHNEANKVTIARVSL
jgi:hypothetical protein